MTTAWQVRRTATANSAKAVSNGASGTLPAGWFTVQDYAIDCTVTNLALGVITVGESGLYQLTASIEGKDNTADVVAIETFVCFYRNSGLYIPMVLSGQKTEIYLDANDTVQPGVTASGWTRSAFTDTGIFDPYNIGNLANASMFQGRRIAA